MGIKLTISSGSSPLIRDISELEGIWIEENKSSCPLVGVEPFELEGMWPEENKSSCPLIGIQSLIKAPEIVRPKSLRSLKGLVNMICYDVMMLCECNALNKVWDRKGKKVL